MHHKLPTPAEHRSNLMICGGILTGFAALLITDAALKSSVLELSTLSALWLQSGVYLGVLSPRAMVSLASLVSATMPSGVALFTGGSLALGLGLLGASVRNPPTT